MATNSQAHTARVSIHAPARGATGDVLDAVQRMRGFDPRSRAGSDRTISAMGGLSASFRSTLPRGERQSLGADPVAAPRVSIHAPARGATSPHRRTRPGVFSFDPRSRAGSDPRRSPRRCGLSVSIHAPARGATAVAGVGQLAIFEFRSTLPRGERPSSSTTTS